MIVTFLRLARTELVRLALVAAGLTVFLFMIVVVFQQAGVGVFKGMEDVSSIARGFDIRQTIDSDVAFANLVGVALAHPLALALFGSFAVGLGARSCAGELHDGTLEMTLARSISRRAYLLGYALYINAALLVLALVAVLATAASDALVKAPGSIDATGLLLASIATWLLFSSIAGASMLVSTLASSRSAAMMASIAVVVSAYFLEFFARLWTTIEWMGTLSPFHWFKPTDVLVEGRLDGLDCAVLGIAAAATTIIATIVFERRDLA